MLRARSGSNMSSLRVGLVVATKADEDRGDVAWC
jgi:hypothetical protein